MGFSLSNTTAAHTMRKDHWIAFNNLKSAANVSNIEEIINATLSLELRITTPDGQNTTVLTPTVNLIYTSADGFLVMPAE